MKLNVGCGEFYADGWTNVDAVSNGSVKPDIIASITDLPLEITDVEQVYLGHVLEHITHTNIVAALSRLWLRCRSGCAVAAVGPDVLRAWNGVIDGWMTVDDAIGATLGARRWPGDEHMWACTDLGLEAVLRESGLSNVQRVAIRSGMLNSFPVVSRAGWQCAAVGWVR